MKKTIVVEFPDGFEFPEEVNCYENGSKCFECPLYDREGLCIVAYASDDYPCPFYGGADTATLIRSWD